MPSTSDNWLVAVRQGTGRTCTSPLNQLLNETNTTIDQLLGIDEHFTLHINQ